MLDAASLLRQDSLLMHPISLLISSAVFISASHIQNRHISPESECPDFYLLKPRAYSSRHLIKKCTHDVYVQPRLCMYAAAAGWSWAFINNKKTEWVNWVWLTQIKATRPRLGEIAFKGPGIWQLWLAGLWIHMCGSFRNPATLLTEWVSLCRLPLQLPSWLFPGAFLSSQ